MKLSEIITEATGSLHDAVMKAVETATNVRHSMLSSIEVTNDEAMFEVVYDFPEHRNGISKEVKAAFKGFGTVHAEKLRPYPDVFVLSFTLEFKEEAAEGTGAEIQKAIKAKYNKDLTYFGKG